MEFPLSDYALQRTTPQTARVEKGFRIHHRNGPKSQNPAPNRTFFGAEARLSLAIHLWRGYGAGDDRA
jgi:hypothetical protein